MAQGHCNSDRCMDSWYGKDDCWCSCATCDQLETVIKERAELARELCLTKKQLGIAQVVLDGMARELQETVDKLAATEHRIARALKRGCCTSDYHTFPCVLIILKDES